MFRHGILILSLLVQLSVHGASQAMPVPDGCLSSDELQLAQGINAMRQQNGLPAIRLSYSLSTVAQWHVEDIDANQPDRQIDPLSGQECNLHSWSDQAPGGLWQAVCYTPDHANSAGMYEKPREITLGRYPEYAFEVAYDNTAGLNIARVLESWAQSSGHRALLLSEGSWAGVNWQSLGVATNDHTAVAWLGGIVDPQGAAVPCTALDTLSPDGIWWDPDVPGQGLSLQQMGDQIQGTWYRYETSGAPLWFSFSGQWRDAEADLQLLRFSGPALSQPWNPALLEFQPAGNIQLRLRAPKQLELDYQLAEESGELALTPFGNNDPSDSYLGIFWTPSLPGQGFNLALLNGRMQGTWYLYDSNGSDLWLTFDANPSGNGFSGALLAFTGPPSGTPWDTSLLQMSNIGSIDIHWLGTNTLQVDFSLAGHQGSQTLVPFP